MVGHTQRPTRRSLLAAAQTQKSHPMMGGSCEKGYYVVNEHLLYLNTID